MVKIEKDFWEGQKKKGKKKEGWKQEYDFIGGIKEMELWIAKVVSDRYERSKPLRAATWQCC